jgi:hypothetical protein
MVDNALDDLLHRLGAIVPRTDVAKARGESTRRELLASQTVAVTRRSATPCLTYATRPALQIRAERPTTRACTGWIGRRIERN